MITNHLLQWDVVGERTYRTGIEHGVLYNFNATSKAYDSGVAWSGLTKVTEKPTGGEITDLYADDTKYLSLQGTEKFEASAEAYDSPEEFDRCDGTAELTSGVTIGQQTRETFGMSYVSLLGNDTMGNDYGYEIHCIYGCKAQPSEKSLETVNDSPSAATMSWEIKTTPVTVPGFKPTANVIINSTKVSAEAMARIEQILWGTPAVEADPEHNIDAADAIPARLPYPDEIKKIIEGTSNP